MDYARSLHQRTVWYALLSLVIVASFGNCQSEDVVCSGSANKNSPPRFLCGLAVNITRVDECAVRVSERITFPHTVDTMYTREVSKFRNIQDVRIVSVKQNGVDVDHNVVVQDSDDFASISFKTKKSRSNSTYELSYVLSNGALQFSKTCDGTDGKSFPDNNVIVWRSGKIDEAVDRLIVRVESESSKRLSFVGLDDRFDSKKNKGVLNATATDVTSEVALYAREQGTDVCKREVVCEEKRGLRAWIIFLIVAGAILALVGAIVVAWFAKRKFGRGGAVQ